MWSPILLNQEERRLSDRVVADVTDALSANPLLLFCGAGLSGGAAGTALFFSALDQDRQSSLPSRCGRWLERAVREAAAIEEDLSLFNGITGIAWCLHRLSPSAPGGRPTLSRHHVIRRLRERVDREPWHGDYDLCTGLVGWGLYALDCADDAGARALVEAIVHRLAGTAIDMSDGAAWWTGADLLPEWQRAAHPDGYVNLGLAHGVPGVIAFLGLTCARGIAVETARPLLDQAVRFLLSQRAAGTSGPFFRHVIDGHGDPAAPTASRVAWCYGDLGVAAALYLAGTSVREADWQHLAIEFALAAAARPMERCGVRDAGLCHGSAGNAHLFNRFYHATRIEPFRVAALHWVKQTLAAYRPGTGIGGYRAWQGTYGWGDVPGLLEGATGIALTLLAATRDAEPAWDRMLLVSLPT